MKNELNSYQLSRTFFDWCFENTEKISPTHIAMYFFIIEHCNRLGWKEKFGLPTVMVKDAIGIRNFRTYTNTLNDLVEWGFIIMVERSKNQYSSNIVAIVKNAKAHTIATTKALDKAMQKQLQKQSNSIVSIDKQETIEHRTIEHRTISNTNTVKSFDFKKAFLQLDVDSKILEDWLKVRKAKKAVNTQSAFNSVKKKMEASGKSYNECVTISAENSWAGFDVEWLKDKQTKYDNRANINKLKEIVYEDF